MIVDSASMLRQWVQTLTTVYSVQTVITGFGCGASNTGKV
jgi:hypothetical protein